MGSFPSVTTSNGLNVLMTDKVIAERANDLICDVLKCLPNAKRLYNL